MSPGRSGCVRVSTLSRVACWLCLLCGSHGLQPVHGEPAAVGVPFAFAVVVQVPVSVGDGIDDPCALPNVVPDGDTPALRLPHGLHRQPMCRHWQGRHRRPVHRRRRHRGCACMHACLRRNCALSACAYLSLRRGGCCVHRCSFVWASWCAGVGGVCVAVCVGCRRRLHVQATRRASSSCGSW